MRLAAACLVAALLAGCASAPPTPLPARDDVGEFAIDARFALRATVPGRPAESSGGRLEWEHRTGHDRILVANPLGVGIAEIDAGPGGARLKLADGRIHEGADPDLLLVEATGQRLPVRRLPDWLLGRGSGEARPSRDALGRPLALSEAGWEIAYSYIDTAAGALPATVTLVRPGEIELRLRIEEWRSLP